MADDAVPSLPYVEGSPFVAIGREAAIGAGEIVTDRRVELEVPPAALAGEGELALDGRAVRAARYSALSLG